MNEGILGGYDPLISPTGRAFMAGEKQGMTPEQMAQSGAISFADAIALKQMAERVRASAQTMQAQAMQAQQMPQPQPTVVDGYIGELRSQVAGSAAMPFREGGLAGLPVQNIGTRAMASGGIVAFAGGNPVQGSTNFQNISKEELDKLSKSPDPATAQAAIRELLNRGGYEPSELPSAELVRERFREALNTDKPTRIRYDPRPFPSHMYDESGRPRVRSESPMLAPISVPATEAMPGSAGSAVSSASVDPGLSSSPFFQTQMDFNEMSPSDPNYRPVSSLGSPGLGPYRTDPRLLNRIGPKLPDVPNAAPTGIAQLTPEETVNQRIQDEISRTIGGASRISAPRLDAGKLYPEVEVSQEEQDKIRGELRNEGEASGLPGLLRRGAERVGQELKDVEKNKRMDTWLLLAQAGFGIAGSAGPIGVALAEAGKQFAGQYAALNKEVKAEMRALNKDQEAYNKSLAEFELNQNAESRRRVDDKRNRMQARQDKIADVAVKQADLDFRAAMANQDAETKRRGMRVQQLLSQIRSTEKVTLSSAYTAAVMRGDVAEQERLIAAMERASKASSAYLTQELRNQQEAMGPGMGGGNYAGFELVGVQ